YPIWGNPLQDIEGDPPLWSYVTDKICPLLRFRGVKDYETDPLRYAVYNPELFTNSLASKLRLAIISHQLTISEKDDRSVLRPHYDARGSNVDQFYWLIETDQMWKNFIAYYRQKFPPLKTK